MDAHIEHLVEVGLCFGFFSPEELGQDVLNARSDLDTDNTCNLVELPSEGTPIEIMLGKVTTILRYIFTGLSLHQINWFGGKCLYTRSTSSPLDSLYHSYYLK